MSLLKDGVIHHIKWKKESLYFLDQTRLPMEEKYIDTSDFKVVCEAIQRLSIRGAPAIGIAGGYALALGARMIHTQEIDVFWQELEAIRKFIASSRPTAVNLFWALDRMMSKIKGEKEVNSAVQQLGLEAVRIHQEDIKMCKTLSSLGKILIPEKGGVMTYCNAGGLATGGYGTALGVIYATYSSIRNRTSAGEFGVIVNETRPLLQGARLTAWELKKLGIPFVLIADNMAARMFANKKVTCVIVGADRIARNGDTANKIGTYNLAILANYHHVPFYVAAPTSTIDSQTESGSEIPIEKRAESEVSHMGSKPITPPGTRVLNPAFDITPSHLITSIITEKGICNPPYENSFERIV